MNRFTRLSALSILTFVSCSQVQTTRQSEIQGTATVSQGQKADLSALTKAIDSAYISEFTDYGRVFSLESHPSTMSECEVLLELLSSRQSDLTIEDFKKLNGDAAVKTISKQMSDLSEEMIGNQDAQVPVLKDIANQLEKTFLPAANFEKIELYSHNIQEDGDEEIKILIVRNPDQTLTSVTYSDFPY